MKKPMRKYIKIFITIAILTNFFLCCGCNDQAAKQQKATVISKKIVMPKKDQKIEPSKPEIKEPEIKEQDLKPKTDKIDTVPDQKIELSETSDSYSYKVEGKIDPFASIFRDVASEFADQGDGKKESLIPLTPIEKVDLSQLKLVGIISAPSGNKALVEDASGKGFVIKKGTRIGINSGRVVEILKTLVVVEEETENILGKTGLVKRELKLQKPPGEE
ncbi:MAG: pilus assembly protein PilP [Desulfobacteraceae bacterium]|nr:pilus assembly protein PilP [Desulfobacteraceae bacterium]